MDGNGNNVKQLTASTGTFTPIGTPRRIKNQIFYEEYGIWVADGNGSAAREIVPNSSKGYSISKDGTIAYVNYTPVKESIDRTHGCIWLANIDGSNQRPFVINNY